MPQSPTTENDNKGCLYCGLQAGYHRPDCPYYPKNNPGDTQ